MTIDRWIAGIMAPLAIWVIVNGLDDLFVTLAAGYAWLRSRNPRWIEECTPADEDLDAVPQRRMAIFVCLWREHRVIRDMIEHNVRNIRYRNYDFFIGVYPNDTQTLDAATDVCRRYPNVHLSVTPHPGGTSKADNLNWIFQRMLLHEETNQVHFNMIVVHDAEDIIHPDDLRWMNYYAQWYDMVQIPVLALPTPFRQFTHGVYCDEFAEFQFKDMPARELLGGFVPSCGVGTGFSRRALESVAAAHSNQIFDATSLTEDYEIGFRIRRLGYGQKVVRIQKRNGTFVATREFFAQNFKEAVRQRSRWVTGIALQSWEKHGFRDIIPQLYWFWRDRKGFVSSLLSPLANVIFVYVVVTWAMAWVKQGQWRLGAEPWLAWLSRLSWWPLLLLFPQTLIRMYCTSLVYGWKFAMGVPLRIPWANIINCCAAAKAAWGYASARIRGVPLRWLKTEHAYPNRQALMGTRRALGEILVGSEYITADDLAEALATQLPGARLGEHLVKMGKLSEEDLYEAIGLQNDLPTGRPDFDTIVREVTRTIPAQVARRWKVLPYRVVAGQLYVASPELPNDQMTKAIKEFCPLEMRFHLVPPQVFQEMIDQYLPPRPPTLMPALIQSLGLLASIVALVGTIGRKSNSTTGS